MTSDRPAVFLHIGAMKTGTTFVQHKLIGNKQTLAAAGVLFAGDRWTDQVRGAQEAVGFGRHDPIVREASQGAWQELADEMLAHRGPSIVSMEFLSFARRGQAHRAVQALAGADVDVVLTVRDTAAIIPAQWQTAVHNGERISWPDYVVGARRATGLPARLGGRRIPDPALRSFLQAADIPRMLRVWGSVVPRERFHVVTVPPPGSAPDLLWERFCRVVGVDPAVTTKPARESNASLGFGSTELLRHVNEELGEQPMTDYNGTVKSYLALKVLAGLRGQESRARLDEATRDFALDWNRRVREAIVDSGVHLVGDLDDLPLTADADAAPFRPAPEEQEILAAAAVAVEAMDKLVRRRIRRRRKRGEDIPPPVGKRLTATSDRWADAEDPVAAAAAEIAGLCQEAIEHRRVLRALRQRTGG